MGLTTSNQAYTMAEEVFRGFQGGLEVSEAIRADRGDLVVRRYCRS